MGGHRPYLGATFPQPAEFGGRNRLPNVSEGRGTASPFLVFGAPWLRPSELHVSVPGFELEPAIFTPVGSPATPNPKFDGQECHGMRVRVTDPAAAQSYRLGVELLVALQGQLGFEWSQDGAALTRLLGTTKVIDALRRGETVDQVIESDRADHEAWRRDRAAALLY